MAEKKIAAIEVVSYGSPPDIDTDFAPSVRAEVYKYVQDTYGIDHVADLGTNQILKAKSALKKIFTVFEVDFAEANRIAKLIPDAVDGKDPSFKDLYDPDSEFYSLAAEFRSQMQDERWLEYAKLAGMLEHRTSATSRHPCGVLISGAPILKGVPVRYEEVENKVTGEKELRQVTEWEGEDCESLGFLKMDFLGLDMVETVMEAIRHIQHLYGEAPNMIDIIHGPMDDPKVYELFQRGQTSGIFQFSSDGVRDLLRKIKPTEFNDIVATTALFRPGPMGMNSHIEYALRKNGESPVTPIHPSLEGTVVEEIFAPTYGLCVFQEQISKIAIEVAGMNEVQADKFRKAMGKKKADVMASMYESFISGGIQNGYLKEAMQALWETIEPFAKYAFNKSHSVAYAMNAYQAIYLLAHYPTAFGAALLAQFDGERDKFLPIFNQIRQFGVAVNGPDVNASQVKIAPERDGVIRLGLSSCAGVKRMARFIVEEREANGPFTSVRDLISRVKHNQGRAIPKQVIASLAKAGAFDSMGVSRKRVAEQAESLVKEDTSSDSETVSTSLFASFEMPVETTAGNDGLEGDDWSERERLQFEREVLIQVISGHPLDNWPTVARSSLPDGYKPELMIAAVTELTLTKKKTWFGEVELDDGVNHIRARLHKDLVHAICVDRARTQCLELLAKGKVPSRELIREAGEYAQSPIRALNVIHAMVRPAPRQTDVFEVVSARPIPVGSNGLPSLRIRLLNGYDPQQIVETVQRHCAMYPGDTEVFATVVQHANGMLATLDWATILNNLVKQASQVDHLRTETKELRQRIQMLRNKQVGLMEQTQVNQQIEVLDQTLVHMKEQVAQAEALLEQQLTNRAVMLSEIPLSDMTNVEWSDSLLYWPLNASTSNPMGLCRAIEMAYGEGSCDYYGV